MKNVPLNYVIHVSSQELKYSGKEPELIIFFVHKTILWWFLQAKDLLKFFMSVISAKGLTLSNWSAQNVSKQSKLVDIVSLVFLNLIRRCVASGIIWYTFPEMTIWNS